MSSIIKTGSILYSFFNTSFCAQDHKIEKNFCSPRERSCFASISFIKNLMSDLCGPNKVVFLLLSLLMLFSNIFRKVTFLSQPLKKEISICLRKSNTLIAPVEFKILLKLFNVFSKKKRLDSVREFPWCISCVFHAYISDMRLSFNILFLCLSAL